MDLFTSCLKGREGKYCVHNDNRYIHPLFERLGV